jgi:hypothetical protein
VLTKNGRRRKLQQTAPVAVTWAVAVAPMVVVAATEVAVVMVARSWLLKRRPQWARRAWIQEARQVVKQRPDHDS